MWLVHCVVSLRFFGTEKNASNDHTSKKWSILSYWSVRRTWTHELCLRNGTESIHRSIQRIQIENLGVYLTNLFIGIANKSFDRYGCFVARVLLWYITPIITWRPSIVLVSKWKQFHSMCAPEIWVDYSPLQRQKEVINSSESTTGKRIDTLCWRSNVSIFNRMSCSGQVCEPSWKVTSLTRTNGSATVRLDRDRHTNH